MSKQIERGIELIIAGLLEIKDHFKTPEEPTTVVTAQAVTPPNEDSLDTFEQLKKALESDRWPEAVNSALICDPELEAEKIQRGRGILELMVEENLSGLKFLDYGCDEGFTANYAAEKKAFTVGYDPAGRFKFTNRENLTLTTSYADVVNAGPYDVILLFDVLDHLKGEDPITVLKKAASVLKDTGKIYVRTHPFTARHATHLYHELNKAYLHLVFTPLELAQLVPNSKYMETSVGVTRPIATYRDWIDNSGLRVLNRKETRETVEPFFKIPKIADRIMRSVKADSFPEYQMSLQFLDFTLAKNVPIVPQPEPQQTA